jgi:hypothetical protein
MTLTEFTIPRTGTTPLSFAGRRLGMGSTVNASGVRNAPVGDYGTLTIQGEPSPGFLAELFETEGKQIVAHLRWTGDPAGGFAHDWAEAQPDMARALSIMENIDILNSGEGHRRLRALYGAAVKMGPFQGCPAAVAAAGHVTQFIESRREAIARLQRSIGTEHVA